MVDLGRVTLSSDLSEANFEDHTLEAEDLVVGADHPRFYDHLDLRLQALQVFFCLEEKRGGGFVTLLLG